MGYVFEFISLFLAFAITRFNIIRIISVFLGTLYNFFRNNDSSSPTETDNITIGSSALVITHNLFSLNTGNIVAGNFFLDASRSHIFLNNVRISAREINIRADSNIFNVNQLPAPLAAANSTTSADDRFIDASHFSLESDGNITLSRSLIVNNRAERVMLSDGQTIFDMRTRTFFSQIVRQQNTHQPSPELILTSTNQDKLDELGIPKEFIPPEFICPIKRGIMDKAVYDPSFPHRYDEAYLGHWLNRTNENPMTRTSLNFSQLKEDTFLQCKINLFVDAMEKEGERLLALPKAEALAELEKILASIHQKAIKTFSIIPYTGTQHSILFASNQVEAREPSLHLDSNGQNDPNCQFNLH